MMANHPNRKNLITSSTFREWLNSQPLGETEQDTSPSLLLNPQYPCADIINQALQEVLAQETTGENNNENPAQETTGENNNENPNQSVQHLQPLPEQEPLENNQLIAQVDDILNEMMVDEVVREMLEQPNPTEDEGIELNFFDEIHDDIQSFDYSLEVEPYDM